MAIDLNLVETEIKQMLRAQCPPLKVRKDDEKVFEIAGTKETMQGKQKVDGFYFASVMPKPKDVRLYFFPIYTHVDDFDITDDLKKALKGKSCFHIKKWDDALKLELKGMIEKGVELYKRDGHI